MKYIIEILICCRQNCYIRDINVSSDLAFSEYYVCKQTWFTNLHNRTNIYYPSDIYLDLR